MKKEVSNLIFESGTQYRFPAHPTNNFLIAIIFHPYDAHLYITIDPE
jgi:hypothetical protein